MKTNEKASFQVLKIAAIAVILMLTFSAAVLAFNTQLNNVKIVLANDYEMNILTTKNKISDILEENHIVLLPDETVFPSADSQIGENKTIIIAKVEAMEDMVTELANADQCVTLEQVLGSCATIVEKIVVEQEVIPYETITKNTTSVNEADRVNQVIQNGKNGLKEVTYKVKYQNDIEISRAVVKEEIIKKAVNKIVQITTATSRGDSSRYGATTAEEAAQNGLKLSAKVEGITPIVKTLNASAYTASTCDKLPTDKGYGITASGKKVKEWYTVAAGKSYPLGTVIYIPALKDKPNGGWFVVQDRGGAIKDNKLDIYMGTYNECIKFGRKNLECYIYVLN